MASSSGTATSSSASSGRTVPSSYDVFINFRGADTRTNFVTLLHKALESKGIHAFLDSKELWEGEEIKPALLKAIRRSRISVPVFSKNYAKSKYCLLELAEIWKCRLSDGQTVLPIFKGVEPHEVRHQIKRFQRPFEKHQRRCESSVVQSWKHALTEVGNLKGWTVKGNATIEEQSNIVELIVQRIVRELGGNPLDEEKHLIGIESHVKEVLHYLHFGSDDVRFVGICGMGGLGKTTIAKVVYNRVFRSFKGSSFLTDVREEASQGNKGLVSLQKRLLHDIFKSDDDISSVSKGSKLIAERLHREKILLILDDVNDYEQLDALIGGVNWFGPGSKVIITTRDNHILNVHEKKIGKDIQIYMPEELDTCNSLLLFSLHAFSKNEPPEHFQQLSHEVVRYTGGLPLSLEVLGSFLIDKDKKDWEDTLEILKDIDNDNVFGQSIKDYDDKVFKKLMISYNQLGHREKTVFLDVACYFNGWKKEEAISLWEACDMHPRLTIKQLIQKHLLKIDVDFGGYECLKMHDQLQYMGRKIIIDDSNGDTTKRSRLWSQDEIWKVLKKDLETQMVEGMLIQKFKVKAEDEFEAEDEAEDEFEAEDVLSCEAFQKMPNLRFLEFDEISSLNGEFAHLPSKLRWFRWRGSKILSPDFYHPELVHLDLSFHFLQQSWDDPTQNRKKRFRQLKVLNLHHDQGVSPPPNFFLRFPCLQRLNLYDCYQLLELPDSICRLAFLKSISVTRCPSFRKLPTSIGDLRHLVELCLYDTNIEELPDGVGQLEKLEKLVVSNDVDCEDEVDPQLLKLPASMGRMKSLHHFDLTGRYQIKKLPDDFSRLLSLEVFIMCINSWKNTVKCFLSESLPDLPSTLTHLQVEDCISLQKIPVQSHLKRLEELSLNNCKSLVELLDLSHLRRLRKLDISYCENLEEIPSLEGTESLEELEANVCRKLRELPDLSKLKILRKFAISFCQNLEKIHGLEGTELLEELDASYCSKLKELPDLSKLKRLRSLNILFCENIEKIPGLEGLKSLEELNASFCSKLKELPDLSKLKRLRILDIGSCENIEKIPGLEGIESLEELNASSCSKLKELLDLSKLKRLRILDIRSFENIEKIPGLEGIESLELLFASSCSKLKELPDLSKLKKLRMLHIGSCKNLEEIHGLTESFEELDLSNLERLKKLPDLSKVKRLRKLNISCCDNLEEIRGLDGKNFLTELNARSCFNITETTRKILGQGRLRNNVGDVQSIQTIYNCSPILCIVFAFTPVSILPPEETLDLGLVTIVLDIEASFRRGEMWIRCMHSIRIENIEVTYNRDIIYIHHFQGFDWFGFPLESKDAILFLYVTLPGESSYSARVDTNIPSYVKVKLWKVLFENKESDQQMPNQQSSAKLVAEFFRWSDADDAEDVEEKSALRASNYEGDCLDEDDNEDDEDTEEVKEETYPSEDTEEAEEEASPSEDTEEAEEVASPYEDIEEEEQEERNSTTADLVSCVGFNSFSEEVWEEEERLTPSKRSYFHYNNDEEMPIQQPNIDDEVPGILSDIEEAEKHNRTINLFSSSYGGVGESNNVPEEVVEEEDETKAGMQFLCRPVKAVWDCFCNCFAPGFSR